MKRKEQSASPISASDWEREVGENRLQRVLNMFCHLHSFNITVYRSSLVGTNRYGFWVMDEHHIHTLCLPRQTKPLSFNSTDTLPCF